MNINTQNKHLMITHTQVEVCNRMKLLRFHQDHRPPYWGTWSKVSRQVTGRRPLGRDSNGLLNYDYDSEGTLVVLLLLS